jgi:bifunctional enzyme CysN/CysC
MNTVDATLTLPQLKIVIVGHVDHGKSTFVGRLFHDTGSLPEGKLEQLQAVAASRGTPFEWANLMDALQSERDQNVTIDTAQIWFRTKLRQYVIIDAPGHEEFLKNMVTGAASADAALLLIDADEGIRENSRRHGYLLSLLGIRQIAVLVNKMDLVGHREERFREIETEYRTWLQGLGVTPRVFIPVAARHGDNIAARSTHMPWYTGPTVLEALDAFESPRTSDERPLRFPVQDVYRFDERRIFAGRVESGTVKVGDRLVFAPSGKTSTVRTIERWSAPSRDDAASGECVGITLAPQIFVERGAVATLESAPPYEGTRITGRIFWLGKGSLRKGKPYKIKLATAEAECEVESIESVIDASTLAAIPSNGGERSVRRHEVAELTLRLRKPLAFDAFDAIAPTGRFVIVDGFDIAGGGIIPVDGHQRRSPGTAASADDLRYGGKVTRAHRVRRNGHPGCVLWLTGPSGSGKSTIAAELEREFFNMGRQAYVLDGDNVHGGLCSDLAFSVRDRTERMRRVAEVAKLFEDAGIVCITALISPRREDRELARQLLSGGRFVEVHVNAPDEVLAQRSGNTRPEETQSVVYEAPLHPEIEIRSDRLTVSESVFKILEHIRLDGTQDDFSI